MEKITVKCDKCNGELELARTEMSMQVFRCIDCGHEVYTHFSMSQEDMKEKFGAGVDLVLEWESQPSKKQVMYLRKIFSDFKNFSLDELMQRWKKDKNWYLGYFQPERAEELKAKAHDMGLRVVERK